MANWFEYKLGKEFVRHTFFNREAEGQWPPHFRQEFPERPIWKMFCRHNTHTRIPTVYFRPDDDGISGITDRLIMEYHKVIVCDNCGEIIARAKEAAYSQPSRG